MRIALVFPSIPPRHDREPNALEAITHKKDWLGQEAEWIARVLSERHPDSEVSVHLMYTLTAHEKLNGVEWFATRPMGFMTRRFFYQGKQWSRKWMQTLLNWKPDLVHWNMNSYAYTFHLAARQLVKRGIPYIYQHHGPRLSRKARVRWVLRYPHIHAARGIYLMPQHEEEYREGLRLDASKHRIIRVGYDERFRRLDREECRKKTGFRGEPTLFWAGALAPRKDPYTVLRAFERVLPDYPKAHFYLAGGGPLLDGVRRIIESSPRLRDHVTVLGYVNNENLPTMENASDIFILGSHGEGFAVASMEAMACGAFPVLTKIPCFIEQTQNGQFGELFTPGDVNECTACLRRAIGDVEYREQIREQLPMAVRDLTWRASAEQLVDLYEVVLQEQPEGAKG